MRRALVFGATGMIGTAIVARFAKAGVNVLAVSRRAAARHDGVIQSAPFNPLDDDANWSLLGPNKFDCVVWSQGANQSDSPYKFDVAAHRAMLDANVVYVSASLAELIRRDMLTGPARLCVISSVWQTVARQDKLSYTVSKAALQGLVRSAAVDLGRDGHLINAVLPGALDTAMTRSMLTSEQIAGIERKTSFERLATPADVAELVEFLCSDRNRSTTGQSIAVDLGFRYAQLV